MGDILDLILFNPQDFKFFLNYRMVYSCLLEDCFSRASLNNFTIACPFSIFIGNNFTPIIFEFYRNNSVFLYKESI